MCHQDANQLIPTNYPLFYLTKAEASDPTLAIKDFFSFAHLPEFREMLWLFFKTMVTGSYHQEGALSQRDRYHLALLYEYLLKLIEASHLINEKNVSLDRS
jgi:hypothetical protein